MIIGIGTDILEIDRLKRSLERDGFVKRIFTEREIAFAEKARSLEIYAGTFSAKEAVAKALGTGFRSFGPREIEILRDEFGKPYVHLQGEARLLAENLGCENVFLSISHSAKHSVAICVIEGAKNTN